MGTVFAKTALWLATLKSGSFGEHRAIHFARNPCRRSSEISTRRVGF